MKIKRNDHDLIIYIDPKNITHQFKKTTSFIDRLEKLRIIDKRFVIESKRFEKPLRIDEIKKYQCLDSLIKNVNNYKNCFWYEDFIKKIERNGKDQHKGFPLKSKADVDSLFKNYLIPLVKSISNGFSQAQSSEFGYLVIDADVSLLKSSHANHRFYTAKILGISSFPLLINGIHETWVKQNLDGSMTAVEMKEAIRNHCSLWKPELNAGHTSSAS